MKTLGLLLVGASFVAGQTCQTTDIPSNGSFDGALTESDCTVLDYIRSETSNLKADALRITLRERLVFRVRMTSTQIDPYLYLLNDRGAVLARNDNSGGGKNSDISIQLAAGTYTIVAGTAVTGLGEYQVTTSSRLAKTCAAQELALTGEAVEGDLVDADCGGVDLAVGSTETLPVDVYRIDVTRPSVLDITMSSQTVTPALSLWDARGRRVGNASASGMTSRLRISVPTGAFTLRASTSRTATGAYRLSAQREDRRVCEPATLVPGETATGVFASSDCRLVDLLLYTTWMGPVDQHRFELQERSVVKLGMQSALLDSVLFLVDSDGLIIASNDDARVETLDSEIYISLPPGTYTVWAADNYGDAGRYTVTLDLEKPRTCAPTAFDAPGTVAVSLTREGCRTMDLMNFSESTAPAVALTMKVTERAFTTVSAEGTGMTPLVRLLAEGVPIGLDGFVSQKSVLLLPGSYTVWVTTRNAGAGELTVTTTTRAPAACEATALAWGEPQNGELTASDCLQHEVLPFFSESASRVDLWKFNVENAGTVRAEVGMENGVPFAFVLDSDFRPIAFDINLTFTAGARVSLPGRAGTFYLMVGSYSGPVPYTVRVTQDGPPTM